MIKKIDILEKNNAEEVRRLQVPSYQVEAELIGCYDIPPLKESIERLQSCGETFFGYYIEAELCGAISVKATDYEVEIYRMVVHPNHFRKGIAQRLLAFVENKFANRVIKVATGAKNKPALCFYEKNGFNKVREVKVREGIELALFEK